MQTHNIEIIRDAAQKLTNDGFSVIPVGTNKVPLIKGWNDFGNHIASDTEIEEWVQQFGPTMQLGIVTGKLSGITVIDIEANGYWDDLPDTCISKTGRGGRHYFYRYSDHLKNGVKVWPLTDIRGDGGFVVVPPSVSTHGDYAWINELDRSKLSDFPTNLYVEKTKRWNRLCSTYHGVPEGQRHDRMTSRAGTLLRMVPKEQWEDEVWIQLQEDNRQNTPPLENQELRDIFEGIGKKETERRSSSIQVQPTVDAYIPELNLQTCEELLNTPYTPDSFLIDRLVPEGMISALTSQAGAGKSLLALEMARCVASGEPFLGEFETKQRNVLIIDQEMSKNTIVGRVQSMISDPNIPLKISYETFLKITKPEHLSAIVEAIKAHDIGFIVLDTLVTFHSGDENQVVEMREVMEAMMKLCADTGATILFLHHQRKGSYGEQASQASMRGSTEIAAKIASLMTLQSKDKKTDKDAKTSEMTLMLQQHKCRLPVGFDAFEIKSVYDEKVMKTKLSYQGEWQGKKSKKEEQMEKVLELLEKDPSVKLTRQEIIDEVGAQKNTDKAIAELVKDGKVLEEKQKGSKAKCYSFVGELEMPEIAF